MKPAGNKVLLVASGDSRLPANRHCWHAQHEMEQKLVRAIAQLGLEVERAHAYDEAAGHGFIASQRQGLEVFRKID